MHQCSAICCTLFELYPPQEGTPFVYIPRLHHGRAVEISSREKLCGHEGRLKAADSDSCDSCKQILSNPKGATYSGLRTAAFLPLGDDQLGATATALLRLHCPIWQPFRRHSGRPTCLS